MQQHCSSNRLAVPLLPRHLLRDWWRRAERMADKEAAIDRSCRESFILAGRAESQITGLLPQLLGSIQVARNAVATFVQEAEIGTAARITELARSIKE